LRLAETADGSSVESVVVPGALEQMPGIGPFIASLVMTEAGGGGRDRNPHTRLGAAGFKIPEGRMERQNKPG